MSDDAGFNFTFQCPIKFASISETVETHNFIINCSQVGTRLCFLLIALFKYFGSKRICNLPSPFSPVT